MKDLKLPFVMRKDLEKAIKEKEGLSNQIKHTKKRLEKELEEEKSKTEMLFRDLVKIRTGYRDPQNHMTVCMDLDANMVMDVARNDDRYLWDAVCDRLIYEIKRQLQSVDLGTVMRTASRNANRRYSDPLEYLDFSK